MEYKNIQDQLERLNKELIQSNIDILELLDNKDYSKYEKINIYYDKKKLFRYLKKQIFKIKYDLKSIEEKAMERESLKYSNMFI